MWVGILLSIGMPQAWGAAQASESPNAVVDFDPSFMVGPAVDVRRFSSGNAVLPGTYDVDLYLNDSPLGRREVHFELRSGNKSAEPCLTRSLLDAAGVDISHWPEATRDNAQQCIDLGVRIPSASYKYDGSSQHLQLSVPQADLRNMARGEVSPSRWDSGITAGMLRYDMNVYRSSAYGRTDNSLYLGMVAGMNYGGWRLRERMSLDYTRGIGAQWRSIETYAQHDLTKWKSTLTVGDNSTRGEIFDSFQLRGVQIASDDRMLPDSLRGYAPVVRGVAQTNAKVEVRQNGYVIYQTTVAPGPFEIRDLNPTGYGSDLQVTVTEANGSQRMFFVPYASVPQLLRAGSSRFSIAAGQYRTQWGHGDGHPYVAQVIYQRGLSNLITGYTGFVAANGYVAGLFGAALNSSIGAFALDITSARTSLPGVPIRQGISWRVSYAKILPQTNTSLTVAAYRYSTSGYYSLAEAMQARSNIRNYGSIYTDGAYRTRDRAQLTVSQRLGESGSLYAMGSVVDYWNRGGRDLQFQIGYSNGARWGSYNISVQRTRDSSGRQDNQIYVSVSIPFGGQIESKPVFSDLNASVSIGHNQTSLQTSTSGTAGTNNAWSYGLNAGYSGGAGTRATSLGVSGSYNGGRGSANASASVGNGANQQALGVSGSIIGHAGGITLGQAIDPDDAVALIEADGAKDAAVTNAPGVKVDSSGYAVVPYLTPYRSNTITLDPQLLPDDVELESTSEDVVPRAGAVVRTKFPTKQGMPMLMRVKTASGNVAPMGANVLNEKGESMGWVGQGGMIFVRGVPQKGRLRIQWGNDHGNACVFDYAQSGRGRGIAGSCEQDDTGDDVAAVPAHVAQQ